MPNEYKELYSILPAKDKDKKDRWVKIAIVYPPNKDGSENVEFLSAPLSTRGQIRKPKSKDKTEE